MTEEQKLKRKRTKLRTHTVNVLVGVAAALPAMYYTLKGIGGTGFDQTVGWFMSIVAGCASGAIAAFIANLVQGQGHQKAVEDNAEEKRSAKGSIVTTGVIAIVAAFTDISKFTWLPKAGLYVFIFAILLWGVPALYNRVTKKD
jgi:peptidoglycan/LPS O-acetylase OafA/YrhL